MVGKERNAINSDAFAIFVVSRVEHSNIEWKKHVNIIWCLTVCHDDGKNDYALNPHTASLDSTISLSISIQNGRRGIEPKTGLNLFLKSTSNVFCIHKTDFIF